MNMWHFLLFELGPYNQFIEWGLPLLYIKKQSKGHQNGWGSGAPNKHA